MGFIEIQDVPMLGKECEVPDSHVVTMLLRLRCCCVAHREHHFVQAVIYFTAPFSVPCKNVPSELEEFQASKVQKNSTVEAAG